LYVFKKNKQENIEDTDLKIAQKMAGDFFGTKSKQKKYDVDKMVEAKQLWEVK
jgi:hypothetical protein